MMVLNKTELSLAIIAGACALTVFIIIMFYWWERVKPKDQSKSVQWGKLLDNGERLHRSQINLNGLVLYNNVINNHSKSRNVFS